MSMAATARVIFQCACVRYFLGRVPPFLPFKGDVTQDDSQSQFLVQQRVAALLRHCLKYSRYEIALCSAKIRRPVNKLHYLYEYFQEPITRSEQLPYQAYVTAFLRASLFLDIFLGTFRAPGLWAPGILLS